jgi:hypothetical protein
MSRLIEDCRGRIWRLLDDRRFCQASNIILAICFICAVAIAAMSATLHLAENV